jgi:hypothetical protein
MVRRVDERRAREFAADSRRADGGSDMKRNDELRERVVELLSGGGAHATPSDVLKDFPPELRGEKPAGSPHTAWEILEHLRIAQHDLLEYALTPGFESPPWPEGYWPKSPRPPSAIAWTKSARAFLADVKKCIAITRDPKRDLLAPIAHAPDTNLLLQLFLVASHNSYHFGQIMLLRRTLEARAGGRRGGRARAKK